MIIDVKNERRHERNYLQIVLYQGCTILLLSEHINELSLLSEDLTTHHKFNSFLNFRVVHNILNFHSNFRFLFSRALLMRSLLLY